jgi:hypothetical protein
MLPLDEHHLIAKPKVIQDPKGPKWLVREIEQVHGAWRSRSLVFSTDGLMRRLTNYPPNWSEWADADLLALAAPPT